MTAISRRDVAAMRLALECLRLSTWSASATWGLTEARAPLGWTPAVYDALDAALETGTPARILRARLALALRVLLRADAGDLGRWAATPTGRTCRRVDHRRDDDGRCTSLGCRCWDYGRPIRPLWERAPAHDPSITPAMRRAR